MRTRRPSPVPVLLVLLGLLLGEPLVRAPGARAVGVWTPAAAPTGASSRGSAVHSATILRDGRVLLIAAVPIDPSAGVPVDPVFGVLQALREVYDPATDRWSTPARIPDWQGNQAPVLLPDGRVFFTGGILLPPRPPGGFSYLDTAQTYDPIADAWTPVAPMSIGRGGHTATLLADGTVLVVGGDVGKGYENATPTASVERYDPRTNRWSPAAPLAVTRLGHTATLLRDGRVLVAGGRSSGAQPAPVSDGDTTATAEVYDPAADRWAPAGSMPGWRGECCGRQTATLLQGGRVLVTGTSQATAALYDPAADRWATTGPMTAIRGGSFTATPLPDGRVLVAGGTAYSGGGDDLGIVASTEVYDLATNAWAGAAPMNSPRHSHVAAALPDGRVLVVGGFVDQATGALPTPPAELYTGSPAPEACFAETGRCVRGPFLTYWQQHGGLAINGYPLSDEFVEVLEDGRAYQVQYFERVRLEYHPENAPPYDILLGQFGRRIRPADPPAPPIPGQEYFTETGHNLGDGFLAYWQANGGLPQFGYPISEVFEERLEDGKVYRVQYFERARFEHHPKNAPPYDILLGQFGRRILAEVERRR